MMQAADRDSLEARAIAGMHHHRVIAVPSVAFRHEGRRFLVADWEQHGIDLYAGLERLAKIAPMDKVKDAQQDVEAQAGVFSEAVWREACEAVMQEHRQEQAQAEADRSLDEYRRTPTAATAASASEALQRVVEATAPEVTAPTGVELFDRLMAEAAKTQGREFLGIAFHGPDRKLVELNKRMDGLRGLTFLGGVPGTGKTSLALQMAFDAAVCNPDTVVVFLTCEMTALEVQASLITRQTMIPFHDLMKGTKKKNFVSASRWGDMCLPQADLNQLIGARLDIDKLGNRWRIVQPSDFGGAFIGSKRGGAGVFAPITELVSRAKRASGAERMLVVVDSLQRVPVAEPISGSVTGWVGESIERDNYVVDALNALASGPGDAVLCITEQNKVQQGTASITSMKGTASIGYACDSTLLLTDPDVYTDKTTGAERMQLDIDKGYRAVEAHLVKGRAGCRRGMEQLVFHFNNHHFTEGTA